jgi:hypothetical protein
VRTCVVDQVSQQLPTQAAVLPVIGNCDGDLRAFVRVASRVAAGANLSLAFTAAGVNRDIGHVMRVIGVAQAAKLFAAQP